MYSSDHPEMIKVTINEADIQLAREKNQAYAAALKANNSKVKSIDRRNVDYAPTNNNPESISQAINQEIGRTSRMLPVKSVRRRLLN